MNKKLLYIATIPFSIITMIVCAGYVLDVSIVATIPFIALEIILIIALIFFSTKV